jgi:hypothetical protein
MTPTPPRPTLLGCDLEISTPFLSGIRKTKVRVAEGAATGTICARGTVTGGDPGCAITAVWGKIIGLLESPGTTIPGDAIPGCPTGTTTWEISRSVTSPYCTVSPADIPNVLFSDTGTDNKLAVWAIVSGQTTPLFQSVTFSGVRDTDTECGGGSVTLVAGAASQSAVIGTAPGEWQVAGEGFGDGPEASLNRAWRVRLRTGAALEAVWDNGGDGQTVPAVELRHCPLKGCWDLVFRFRSVLIVYRSSGADWHWLGVNVLLLAAETSVGFRHVPSQVRLLPV